MPLVRLFNTHEYKFGFFHDTLAMGSIRALIFDPANMLGREMMASIGLVPYFL